jgi:mRNA interferase RelE/StbE
MWNLEFLKAALDDLESIDFSLQKQVLKAIEKVSINPISKAYGGYGTPLGNKSGINLVGLYKIKLLASGIRVVYGLNPNEKVMTIIVIGLRSGNAVYKEANKRR